jgi:hypothetical protein
MGESGIFYVQFWSLQNLVWGLERTTLTNPTRLLTQHVYQLLVPCTKFATAVTADSARVPAYVKLLYTSEKYGQQIPSASYDVGVTRTHCTTRTRTLLQLGTTYDKTTSIDLRAQECAAAQPQPSCPSPNHHMRLPRPSRPSPIDLPARRCPIHA